MSAELKSYPEVFGKRPWTPEEVSYLRIVYRNQPTKITARHLRRELKAVRDKARQLGVVRPLNHWTAEEVAFLRNNYRKLGPEGVAKVVNRTPLAVKEKASQQSINQFGWRAQEAKFVAENYYKLGAVACAEHLGRTPGAVRHYASSHGMATEDTKVKAQPSIKTRALIASIAVQHGCKSSEILGRCRRPEIIRARYAVAKYLRDVSGYSYPKIGKHLGRHHSTIIKVMRRVAA